MVYFISGYLHYTGQGMHFDICSVGPDLLLIHGKVCCITSYLRPIYGLLAATHVKSSNSKMLANKCSYLKMEKV